MTIKQGVEADTILSHYRIVSKLGSGGMGEVYLAQDTSELGRTVALKILSSEVASHKDRLQRFTQEARTVSNLNHPNILTVHEFGQSDSVLFIATEFIDGVTLREHLSCRSLRLVDVLDVIIQIVAALNAAHEAGVTHRDLKPENVMVRRDQIIKVLDFGLAKLSEPSTTDASAIPPDSNEDVETKVLRTEPGLVMGTVAYLSPEQSAGKPVDHRTDIWSIGVVLYEMIAGCLPFHGKDIHRQIISIQEAEPTPLSQQVEGAPERLEEIITKCLAKDRNERYQSARDLLIDLRNLRRKLDVDAEIERTNSPLRGGVGVGSPSNTEGSQMNGAVPAATTSSAEYIVSGIKQHKIAAIIVVLFLVAGSVSYGFYLHARDTEVAIESIAVLPFENKSNDPDADYLSDGLAESVIYRLSQLTNLKVSPTSSVLRYKGRETDVNAIGNALKVNAVMTGRMVKHGDNITISAELVDAKYNKLIWGEHYERKMSDLVLLQNEIARDISSKLKVKLSGADEQKLAKNYTNDSEAYRLYLQGRFYLHKRVGKLFDQAEGYFKQAIEKDPNFALGYVGLAEFIGERDRPKAKEYILRALSLDNQLSDAHANLGYQLTLDYDFVASERELKRAIELDPNNVQAHQWNANRLMMMGRYDESRASFDRAIEIEPTLTDVRNNLAACLVASGRIDEGIDVLKQSITKDPTFAWLHSHISYVYRLKGDHATSVEERARSAELLDQPENAKRMRETFARDGWTAYVRDLLRQDWGSLRTSQTRRASFLAELGEKEEAMASLIDGAEKGDWWLFSIKYDPAFDSLRGDPRFQELLKKFQLPQ